MPDISQRFMDTFFASAHNAAWPDHQPAHPAASYLGKFIEAPRHNDECPLVVPRKIPQSETPATYVVCWNAGHATRIRALLEASVAHSWTSFPGRTAILKESDPSEKAILELAGPDTTFRLTPPNRNCHTMLWKALDRLIVALETRPTLAVAIPRPVGRMLRDFEASLSAGQADTSSALLREIETTSGISLENLAFLTVRRLSKLGLDKELLAQPSLDALVRAEPPQPIRDAVLGAWSRQQLGEWDWSKSDSVEGASELLESADPPVGLLAYSDLEAQWAHESLLVLALTAIERQSTTLANFVLAHYDGLPLALSTTLAELVPQIDEEPTTTEIPQKEPEPEKTVPDSWQSWLESVLTNPSDARLSSDLTASWKPVGEDDPTVAELISSAPDSASDALLAMVGPFLEADQYLYPAWRTANALIQLFLVAERFAPGELGVLSALVGVAVRGAPPAQEYRELLADIQDFAPRWVSAAYPSPTLDLVDALAGAPIPDPRAATQFATAVLSPLKAQQRRLGPALRRLAALLCGDLGVPLEWDTAVAEPEEGSETQVQLPGSILLYSLNESALRRASLTLEAMMPDTKVVLASDKVGSPRLRDQVRGADVVVLTTQCATHAATGFITEHMSPSARLVYPDGPGAGSLLRAIESELDLA